MTDWASSLAEPTLLVGDFNIAPFESDVWSHKQLLDVVSHTPIEVATLAGLRDAHGWIDLGRRFVPEPERLYTWWSYRAKDWRASDRGRRLDHMWASPVVAGQAIAHHVFEDWRDGEKPSDHIPIMTEFAT
jgi:exodeoxyribonuclease-3